MRARVRFEVEVDLDQPWGPDETVAVVHERAGREGVEKFCNAMGRARESGIKVVGQPRVTGIITED